jgi:hypothetical protein
LKMTNKMTKEKVSRSRGRKSRGFTAKDDIPLRPLHTYCTASCPLPVVTDSCVIRALGHGTLSSSASSVTATSLTFSLSQSGINSGTWDQYKLLAVRVTIVPDQNAVGLFTNTTTSYTPLYFVLDFDDATNLTSYVAAEAYSNCVVLGAGESCERLFKPRTAVSAYTGAFGGFANMSDLWIDAASNTVQHYGAKIFVPQATAAQTLLPSWQISTEYFFAFRKSI